MELQNQHTAPSSLEIFPRTVRVTYFPPAFLISATLTILAEMWGSKERRWEHFLLERYFKVNEKSASPFAPSASCSHPQTSADLQQQPEFSNPQLSGCGGRQPTHGQPKTGQASPLGHLEPLSTQAGLKPVIPRGEKLHILLLAQQTACALPYNSLSASYGVIRELCKQTSVASLLCVIKKQKQTGISSLVFSRRMTSCRAQPKQTTQK